MKTKPPRPRRQRITPAQLAIKSGDAVLVRLDSGIRMPSVATCNPFQWFHGVWMINVEGMGRKCDLSRVQPTKGL